MGFEEQGEQRWFVITLIRARASLTCQKHALRSQQEDGEARPNKTSSTKSPAVHMILSGLLEVAVAADAGKEREGYLFTLPIDGKNTVRLFSYSV